MNTIKVVMCFILGYGFGYLLTGCSVNDAISDNLKEEKFDKGCKVTHANTNIGYLSNTGVIGVPCKLKCSKELPPGYCFKYSTKTPYGTCDVRAGSCIETEVLK